MGKQIALVCLALLLIIGAAWAFFFGANHELWYLSPSERMSVLDTTMIGEKWALIAAGLTVCAVAAFSLASVLHRQERRKSLR